jgi:Mor family transcriptional regulator
MTGKGTEKKERNKELFNDWASGTYTVKDLVKKYGISHQAIYQIVKRIKIDILPSIEPTD